MSVGSSKDGTICGAPRRCARTIAGLSTGELPPDCGLDMGINDVAGVAAYPSAVAAAV